jgi:hypothetical protein
VDLTCCCGFCTRSCEDGAGGGGKLLSPERVGNCHSCYGTLREPTMPNAHAQLCLCTAIRVEFITKHIHFGFE